MTSEEINEMFLLEDDSELCSHESLLYMVYDLCLLGEDVLEPTSLDQPKEELLAESKQEKWSLEKIQSEDSRKEKALRLLERDDSPMNVSEFPLPCKSSFNSDSKEKDKCYIPIKNCVLVSDDKNDNDKNIDLNIQEVKYVPTKKNSTVLVSDDKNDNYKDDKNIVLNIQQAKCVPAKKNSTVLVSDDKNDNGKDEKISFLNIQPAKCMPTKKNPTVLVSNDRADLKFSKNGPANLQTCLQARKRSIPSNKLLVPLQSSKIEEVGKDQKYPLKRKPELDTKDAANGPENKRKWTPIVWISDDSSKCVPAKKNSTVLVSDDKRRNNSQKPCRYGLRCLYRNTCKFIH